MRDDVRIIAADSLFTGGEFEPPSIGMFFPEPWRSGEELGIPGTQGIDLYLPLLVLAVGATMLLWSWFSRSLALVPSRRQSLGEMLVTFIRDQITRPTMGEKGDRYLPLMITLFTFILLMNLTGLIPGMLPVNSNIAFPAALALFIFAMTIVIGVRSQGGWGYFRNQLFPSGMPWPLYFVVTPIEALSVFVIRPLTHALRLFATMFAGSLLLAVFAYGGWFMLSLGAEPLLTVLSAGLAGVALAGYTLLVVFELLIMVVQAFIFTLLASLYFSQSLEAAH